MRRGIGRLSLASCRFSQRPAYVVACRRGRGVDRRRPSGARDWGVRWALRSDEVHREVRAVEGSPVRPNTTIRSHAHAAARDTRPEVVDGAYIKNDHILAMADRRIDLAGPESRSGATDAPANRRKSYQYRGAPRTTNRCGSCTKKRGRSIAVRRARRCATTRNIRGRHDALPLDGLTADCDACPAKLLFPTRTPWPIERREPLIEITAYRQKIENPPKLERSTRGALRWRSLRTSRSKPSWDCASFVDMGSRTSSEQPCGPRSPMCWLSR